MAMKHDPNVKFYKVGEVAKLLRVSPMTVYRLLGTGELSHHRVGESYRISPQHVDDYLAATEVRI